MSEEVSLLGLERAPIMAVDGFQGVVATNGTVKINFFTVLHDPVTRAHIRRAEVVLSMGLPTLVLVQKALDRIVSDFRSQGLITETELAPEQKQ